MIACPAATDAPAAPARSRHEYCQHEHAMSPRNKPARKPGRVRFMRRPCNRESANKAKSDVRSGESNRRLSDRQAMVSFDRGAVIERSKRKERTCGRGTEKDRDREKDRRSERDTRVPSSPSPRPAHAATSSLSCVWVSLLLSSLPSRVPPSWLRV